MNPHHTSPKGTVWSEIFITSIENWCVHAIGNSTWIFLSFIFPECSVSEAVSVSLVLYRLLGAFLRFVLVHGKSWHNIVFKCPFLWRKVYVIRSIWRSVWSRLLCFLSPWGHFWGLLAVSLLYFSVYEMMKKGTNRLYPVQDRGSFGPDLGPNSLQRIYSRRQKSLLAKLKC